MSHINIDNITNKNKDLVDLQRNIDSNLKKRKLDN